MKNPLTLAGIEQVTFRFVAQRLNHCATAVILTEGQSRKSSGVNCGEEVESEDLDWDGWKMLKNIYGRWRLKIATEGRRQGGICIRI